MKFKTTIAQLYVVSRNKILLCLDKLSQHETWCGYRLVKQSLEEQPLSSLKTNKHKGLALRRARRIVLFPLVALQYVRGLTSPPYIRSQCYWSATPLVVNWADLFFFLHGLAKPNLDSISRQLLRPHSLLDQPRFLRGLFLMFALTTKDSHQILDSLQ